MLELIMNTSHQLYDLWIFRIFHIYLVQFWELPCKCLVPFYDNILYLLMSTCISKYYQLITVLWPCSFIAWLVTFPPSKRVSPPWKGYAFQVLLITPVSTHIRRKSFGLLSHGMKIKDCQSKVLIIKLYWWEFTFMSLLSVRKKFISGN